MGAFKKVPAVNLVRKGAKHEEKDLLFLDVD
jgi:hypothetical protein